LRTPGGNDNNSSVWHHDPDNRWHSAQQGSSVEADTQYVPSADQLELAGTMEDSLVDLLPLSRLHQSHEEDAATWTGLADMGVFGISLSEEHGGSGLGATEEALIVMALGRRLAAPSVYATIGATQIPLAGIAPGSRVAAGYRSGERCIVIADPDAQLLLLRERTGAALYRCASGQVSAIERRLWLATLGEARGLGAPLAQFDAAQVLRLRLIDAAALAGVADGAFEMAVAYAKVRVQFGKPIGSFQAVKHHCANMVTAARCARDQVLYAAVALDEQRPDAELQVECALYVAGTAAVDNAGKNIQIHGGIGFSDEADPHLFLKRARVQLEIAGGVAAANMRIADIKAG
jgi:alkylation response protein AidB-like acyl-CoA dehydrogenase